MSQKVKNYYHFANATLANIMHQNPSKDMVVIGVTGTDGKTTTASIIYHMLHSLGKPVALISTVGAIINGKEYDTGLHVSTPGSFTLQKYLVKAKEAGIKYLVLEVTSHALDQFRVHGVHIDVGILTNISREHLDYHKTMDQYVKTKVKLLNNAKTAIINKDDQSFELIKPYLKNKSIKTYGLKNADFSYSDYSVPIDLPGDYNSLNVTAALAALYVIGIDEKKGVETLKDFKSPQGRYEVVYDKRFKVIIDFAHTPSALYKLLSTFTKKKGRLIHVFGSAGERDAGKRAEMGKASAEFADISILTLEDPRFEDVTEINAQIKKDMDLNKVKEIIDRQEAIDYAISTAKPGDTVIITGKGHEKSLNTKGVEASWSEHEAVKKALQKNKYE